MKRTEGIEVRKKNEELPVKTVAKAVALSISAEAKLEILKDTLKQALTLNPHNLLNSKNDPVQQLQRTNIMEKNTDTAKQPDALDRIVNLIEVLVRSPHLAFGVIVWSYVTWFVLAFQVGQM